MPIIQDLSNESYDKFEEYNVSEAEGAYISLERRPIAGLIGEYGAFARLLIDLEQETKTLKEDYDKHLDERKTRIMEEQSIKATPAKQIAREELSIEYDAFQEKQRDIEIAKYSMRVLDYEIRYKISKEGDH